MNELEAVIKAINLFSMDGIKTKACLVEFSYEEDRCKSIDKGNLIHVYFKREFDKEKIKMFTVRFLEDDTRSYRLTRAASRLIEYLMYAKDYKADGPGGVIIETYSKETIINKDLNLLTIHNEKSIQ